MFSILSTLLFIHMLAVLLLESPCVIIFSSIFIISVLFMLDTLFIICQWNKGLYLLLHYMYRIMNLEMYIVPKSWYPRIPTLQSNKSIWNWESTLHILLDSKSYCLNYFNYFSLTDLAQCFSFFSITILTYLYIAEIPFFQLFFIRKSFSDAHRKLLLKVWSKGNKVGA